MTIFESFWMTIFIFFTGILYTKMDGENNVNSPVLNNSWYNQKNFTIKLENIYVEFYELFVALF